MGSVGLQRAMEAAGGIDALVGASGPSWSGTSEGDRSPAGRTAEVSPEAVVGSVRLDASQDARADETALGRARQYRLLAALLVRAPDAERLRLVAAIRGDASPLGMAHLSLAAAAGEAGRPTDLAALQREYFHLFVGLGRGEFLPYASYYLTGFLHERPLARLREDLGRLGFEAVEGRPEPEDHIASVCDVMAALAEDGAEEAERAFFERHLKPWAGRFFAELELSDTARFYKPVGLVGRLFMDIEADAFAMPA